MAYELLWTVYELVLHIAGYWKLLIALPVFTFIWWHVMSVVKFSAQRGATNVAVVGGWVPVVGCAVQMGKAPLYFLKECQTKYGDMFIMNLAGKKILYMGDIADYDHVFRKEPWVSFVETATKFTKMVGIHPDAFRKYNSDLHRMVKTRFAAEGLDGYLPEVAQSLQKEFDYVFKSDKGEYSLLQAVRRIMFFSVIRYMFGKKVTHRELMNEIFTNYIHFDEEFELGSSLPSILIPKWQQAKKGLQKRVREMISTLNDDSEFTKHSTTWKDTFDDSILKSLKDVVDPIQLPYFATLLLWASQGNAIPSCFWSIYYLLRTENRGILEKVRREIDDAIERARCKPGVVLDDLPVRHFDMNILSKMKTLRGAVLEAARLHPPGILIRRVLQDQVVRGITIPRGNYVGCSAFWGHRDPRYFPEPEKFMPERWDAYDTIRGPLHPAFYTFGGGRFSCPGKWFALLEMQMLVITFLRNIRAEFKGEPPQVSYQHLLGVQQPDGDCPILYERINPPLVKVKSHRYEVESKIAKAPMVVAPVSKPVPQEHATQEDSLPKHSPSTAEQAPSEAARATFTKPAMEDRSDREIGDSRKDKISVVKVEKSAKRRTSKVHPAMRPDRLDKRSSPYAPRQPSKLAINESEDTSHHGDSEVVDAPWQQPISSKRRSSAPERSRIP